MCVQSSFGYFQPEVIVEWIEVCSLFEVTRFNIYNAPSTTNLSKIFNYYVDKGLVELRQMLPAVEDFSENGVRLNSSASLNDCILCNMYSNRYVVVVDYDEIIVARLDDNYTAMLEHVNIEFYHD